MGPGDPRQADAQLRGVSPSGTGVHAIVRGRLDPQGRNRVGQIELARWTDPSTGCKRSAPVADDGIVVTARRYTIAFFDHTGRRVEVGSKTSDLDAARQLANKLETEAMQRSKGLIDPKAERVAQEDRRPLAEHLAHFVNTLVERDPKHVRQTHTYAGRIIQRAGTERISDLSPSAVQDTIGELRESGLSLRTCNAHLRAVKSFVRWLWRDGRTSSDPLAHLQAFNIATDRRLERRDLSPEELARLFNAARCGPVRFGMSGVDRSFAYRLAVGTGFRVNELRSLTPKSFDLDSDPPTATVRAGYSKRKRDDVQPIRRDLAELLRPWLAAKVHGERVLPLARDKTARMVQADLAGARQAWIDEAADPQTREARQASDFLSYKDRSGRLADFHSLRHTYISMLARSGAPVKVVQELAGHSTPTLTLGCYTHTRLSDRTAALDALPPSTAAAAMPELLRATGTDGEHVGQAGSDHTRSGGLKCQQNRQQSDGETWLLVAKAVRWPMPPQIDATRCQ